MAKKKKYHYSDLELASMSSSRAFRKSPAGPHKSVSKKTGGRPCLMCDSVHSRAEHAFHGIGSYARTHGRKRKHRR